MANFTSSQPIIDFLTSATEEEIKNIVDGLSPADVTSPTSKPLGYHTIYGALDGSMQVVTVEETLLDSDIPNDAICLSIGNGVTAIASNSFAYSGFTGSLILPNSVTSIGAGAFTYSSFDGGLIIGDGVTDIGNHAFYDCDDFTGDLVIGKSVESIGSYAFQLCSGFEGDLVIPSSVTDIGPWAFAYCSGLTNINCYTTKTILDVFNTLVGTSVATIHARASDSTWTEGSGQVIGFKTGITVIKDL